MLQDAARHIKREAGSGGQHQLWCYRSLGLPASGTRRCAAHQCSLHSRQAALLKRPSLGDYIACLLPCVHAACNAGRPSVVLKHRT